MAVGLFFIGHWFLSLFSQTFFLHRYSAHRMFSMSKFWERAFYLFTYCTQGSSFLNPRAYAIMHRMHHAYSDTEKDPHSPHYFKSMFKMMWRTKDYYLDLLLRRVEPEKGFDKNIPEWPAFDRFANSWTLRFVWVGLYILFYVFFATSPWLFLLLPLHFIMGPIHGGIVNWCGHKYGYVNFHDTGDLSRNTLPFDFLTLGELFQNNHHKRPSNINFAARFFEIDPTYPFIKILSWLRIINFSKESV
ncbi:MAG: acyl-CoA desaturase [Ignavibacteriales bacterium]|nr:acyl-CoA desaturase [Ignavibacteriales bacterium]MBI3788954.1 acyl-CoA desaturase [Ignavibacteriales bacterium]